VNWSRKFLLTICNLSLSISETIRGDTQTQVDTLKQVFNDLFDVMSSDSTEENKDKIYANLIISVKNLMSDLDFYPFFPINRLKFVHIPSGLCLHYHPY
jgi:O-phosphoseryl-tRNA(Cys) synthetase